MIREAGREAHDELLKVVNASYDAGRLPLTWKLATIVPIPKPREPNKSRPISLISCLGKTAEKMILARLQWVTGSLHKHIYAFTSNKGARDCITEMLTSISGRKAVVTFIDLEKAFETASAPAILESLAKRGARGKLLRWTKDFLNNRQARVCFQGSLSEQRTFTNGTPQGSILSPFLFNILAENFVTLPLGAGTKILCYADDIAVITTGSRHVSRAQTAINAVATKCRELGLKINTDKTKTIHFGSCQPLPPLKLHDTHIDWAESHPYLGIWLDAHLRFNKHIAAIKDRTRARLRIMRAMAGLHEGASYPVLRIFYIQAIRSVIEYGAPCLAATTPASIQVLEKLQNHALRIIVGAPRWTRVCALQMEASIPPLQARLHATHGAHLAKVFRREENATTQERLRQALLHDTSVFRRKTWAAKVAEGIKTLHSKQLFLQLKPDPSHYDYKTPPPWQEMAITLTTHKLTQAKAKLGVL